MMLALQAACLLIVVIQIAAGARRATCSRSYLRQAAVVAAASWIAEDSCIRLYGFYAYSPEWGLFVDQMPLMIAIIWPAVVLSDWELARHLCQGGRRAVLLAAGLVIADASFMEPVAVQAGLWRWFEPGFFGVPPIGVAGWGMFAGLCVALLTSDAQAARALRRWPAVMVLATAAGTHLLLLTSWWGGFRWVSRPLPDAAVASVSVVLGIVVAAIIVRRRLGARVPLGAMLTRIPAAALFFLLLGREASSAPLLVLHALAFAPPYIALTVGAALARRKRPEELQSPGRRAD